MALLLLTKVTTVHKKIIKEKLPGQRLKAFAGARRRPA